MITALDENPDRNSGWPNSLLDAGVFPHPVEQMQLIETHISWVVLTGRFAYKIKKPLNLGFLDFSTLERRKYFCERELLLNRRFSENLYLDVIPLTGCKDHPLIGGLGEPIDYAIKMRQFDNRLLLDTLAKKNLLTDDITVQMARLLARFHCQLQPVEEAISQGAPENFSTATKQNFEQIRQYTLEPDINRSLLATEKWMRSAYQQCLPTMRLRQQQGNIKDCHGDCHLGNIAVIDNEVTLFDCLEFNDSFRIMDTIAESAFLSMDLCAHNLAQQSQRFLNVYMEYCGDYASLPLLNLYRSYYALVRAKVYLMKKPSSGKLLLDTENFAVACRYVKLAEQFTIAKKPMLVLMHGLSGSGKSWLAEQLMTVGNTIRVRSDVERKRLFNQWPERSGGDDQILYSKQASRATFDRLLILAQGIVSAGFNCIVDATFLASSSRKPFLQMAQQENLQLAIVSCSVTDKIIVERLQKRIKEGADPSDATVEIYELQKSNIDEFQPEERKILIEVDTAKNDCVKDVIAHLAL